jgi:hypothetical protein
MHDLTSPPANGICDTALQAVITLATYVKTKLPSHRHTGGIEKGKKKERGLREVMANDYSAKQRRLYDIL